MRYNAIKKVRALLSGVLRDAKHFGFRYKCPICGYTQSSFKPIAIGSVNLCDRHIIGGGARPCNCWHCNSSDRERLVYLYCKNDMGLFSSKLRSKDGGKFTMLHIAPERKLSIVLKHNENIDYIAGDFHMPGYYYPDYVRHMDITDIQMKDDSFDMIICCHVLEHILDDRKALRELCRVLKPGGTAILQVPICPDLAQTDEGNASSDEERWRRFGQNDHVRLYGADYKSRLEDCGFTVEVVEANPAYAKYGVNPEEKLYIARLRP